MHHYLPTETFLHLNILLLLLTLTLLSSASYTSKTRSPMKPETFKYKLYDLFNINYRNDYVLHLII